MMSSYSVQRRTRPTTAYKVYLWCKLYGYYYAKSLLADLCTVVAMAAKLERRLYFLYSTNTVVEVTALNYLQRVRVDAGEWALIKTKTDSGVSYTKAERF